MNLTTSSDVLFYPRNITTSIPKLDSVGILEPRKRRMVLIVSIVAIAIIIATTVTIVAFTQNSDLADVDCKEQRYNIITKENVLSYFKSIIGHQTISGLLITPGITGRYKGLEITKRKSGKTPAILSLEMPKYLARERAWQSFTNKVICNWKEGNFVHLVWEKNENPLGSMKILGSDNETDWNDLIKNGGQLNKVWKKELDRLAVYLKQLHTAGVVHILDILPFMNWKYGLWSARRGVNGSVKLYQLTHDYLTKHHSLDSLIWALSFDKNGGLTNLGDYWPGDQYVDVVVIYVWKNEQLQFTEYQHVLDVAGNKAIAMEGMESIPSTYLLLTAQPRWTWFTIFHPFLVNAKEIFLYNINSTFNHPKIINKENFNLFKFTT